MQHGSLCRLLPLCLLPLLLSPTVLAQLGGGPPEHDPFARVQFIHNVPDAGPVDVYLDNALWLDDFDFRTATSFAPIPNGSHTFDIVARTDTLVASPYWTGTLTVLNNNRYVLIAQGLVSEMQLALRQNVRPVGLTDQAEFFVVHGAPDTGPLDIRLRDPAKGNALIRLLQNNILYGQASIYVNLPPSEYNFEVTTADNRSVLDVYHFNLGGHGGQPFILLTSGFGQSASEGLALIGFDEHGSPILPTITTASADEADLPASFTLVQNYPNPFNPTTQIEYTLSQATHVRLTVFDLLGRTIRSLVNTDQPAGAYRLSWNSRTDGGLAAASGTYLYRLDAGDVSQTRTMVLIR